MFGSICKRTFTIRFKWHRQKTTFWTWQIFSFCTKKNMEVVWNCWNKKNTHTHISTNITEIVYKSKWMKKRQVWNLNKCFYGVKRNCRQVHTSKCIVLKLDRTFIFSNIEQFVTRSSTQKWNQPCWLCSSSFFFCLFSTCCFCFFFSSYSLMPHSKHSCVTWPFFRSHFRILLSTFLLASSSLCVAPFMCSQFQFLPGGYFVWLLYKNTK